MQLGVMGGTELEQRVLVFGWPTDGVAVWKLRFASEREAPSGFGRFGMANSMDERVEVMNEHGAMFYENPDEMNELGKMLQNRQGLPTTPKTLVALLKTVPFTLSPRVCCILGVLPQ